MSPSRFQASVLAAALVLAACAAPGGGRALATAGDADALMAAAEADLASGNPGDARNWIAGLKPDQLSAAQRARLQLLSAEILLADDKPVDALQMLPVPGTLRDPDLALRAEADRARILFRMGDAVGATRTLVAREKMLADPAARDANRALLWEGLRTTDLDATASSRLVRADAVTRGWIEFATIRRSVWIDSAALQARLAQWRAEFPQHPAEEHVAEIGQPVDASPRERMKSVALLLPLTGPLAGGAEAVRDGFMAAWYGARDAQAAQPAVRVFDSGNTADTLMAGYRAALDAGAEFVVGPLTREDVTALAGSGRLAVPVLALNYLDPGTRPPFNLYQWGLAPEDEARQAAERAITERQYRAVALVPSGEWGERVLAAFTERLTSLGGSVVASATYETAERDHSVPIRQLFALDASEERHRALTNILGEQSQFHPRRRDDVNLVFVAARPDQAKLLGPQLRFHRSGELPIYATALIYDGDPPAADLSGLRFCDMPWMMAQDGDVASLRSRLRTLFPARPKEYTRLLALGHDAYTLVQLIEGGQLQAGSFFPSVTGTLTLRADGVIARGLSCAEIRNGTLKPLEAPLTSSR